MGPQHESCGKLITEVDRLVDEKLQWGRNMRVAESKDPRSLKEIEEGLQWGRNMRVAESA